MSASFSFFHTLGMKWMFLATVSAWIMPSSTLAQDRASETIDRVIVNAESYMGVRYCYGGTSRSCTDCSGLMMNAFRQAGYPLLRTSRQQVTQGRQISRNQLKRGDLIFFGTRQYISHVALVVETRPNYVRFIHAASKNGKVAYDVLRGNWSSKYVTARRIIESDYDNADVPVYVDHDESSHNHSAGSFAFGKGCSCGFAMPSFEEGDIPGKYPQTSQRLINPSELSGLSNRELQIMRNEIFARKGYRFQSEGMRKHFRNLDWYQNIPKTHCNKSVLLSSIEQQNVILIRSFEDG